MKIIKKIVSLLCVLSIIFSANAFAVANVIKINGIPAEIPENMGKIRETDDRTFVPVRFISEFLENDVWFDDALKTAGVSGNNKIILIQDGNSTLYITSMLTGETSEIQMDTAAFIDPVEGRTYLPIRFLAEALGYIVGWDEETQTVTLDKE